MRRRRRGGERGAVLVEAALVVPIVVILTLGMIELGLAFNEQGTIRGQTRAAARAASALPKAEYTQVVEGVLNVMNTGMRNLTTGNPEYVLVFEATGDVPKSVDECVSHSGRCTVHRWNDATEKFEIGHSAGTPWAPAERAACAGQTEKIGVFVRVNHPLVTGVPIWRNEDGSIDDDVSLSAATVMALEPAPPRACHEEVP